MAKYTAQQLKEWDVSTPNKEGKWVSARPMNHQLDGLRRRLKLAWGVFTGKLDALDWQEEQHATAKGSA